MENCRCLIALIFAFMIEPVGAQPAGPAVPFQLQECYRIVVTGAARGVEGIRMMIDTGADCSVVDRELVKRLGLSRLSESVQFNAFGRTESTCRAVLPALRVGPIFTTLPCLIADIPYRKVDVILGLDLLRRYPFAIDWEERILDFGAALPPDETVSFDPASSLVIIPMDLGGESIRVMVDTGADCLYLFRGRMKAWVIANSVGSRLTSTNLAGKSGVREVRLERIQIGTAAWRDLPALIVEAVEAPGCDGALGIASLGLKRIHFDFRRGVLGFLHPRRGTGISPGLEAHSRRVRG